MRGKKKHMSGEAAETRKKEQTTSASVNQSTFSFFFNRLGFGHGETLHGLVFLLSCVLLLCACAGVAVCVRLYQHAAVEGVAVPVRRIAAAMVDWRTGSRIN